MNNDAEIKSGMIRQCTDEVYTAEQYAKDHVRMCLNTCCGDCPIGMAMKREIDALARYRINCLNCIIYSNAYPNKVVAITRDWAKEHPEAPEK